MSRVVLFLWMLAALPGTACLGSGAIAGETLPPYAGHYLHGAVAADHPEASRAGLLMLQKGGNAVDAAVATSLALSVVRPGSCGIGGGGFMVVWNAKTKTAVAIDYRERAPAAASADMYLNVPGGSQRGGLAVAVPGTIAGLNRALKDHGTLDFKTVLQPALDLATRGVPIDEHDISVQKEALNLASKDPAKFQPLVDLYLNSGKPWKTGDVFHSPQKAAFEILANDGPEAFYHGAIAKSLVDVIQKTGGVITLADLDAYRPTVRPPLTGSYHGRSLVTMPPPSSGGICLLETLNILSAYEKAHPGQSLRSLGHNTPAGLHLLVEALKHAYADRAEYLGDADYTDVPVTRLLSAEHAARLAAKIDASKTFPPEHYGRFEPPTDGGTSHFSIVDQDGNAVACTETINLLFGSLVVDPVSGIVLNNEMDDFTAVPGKPNAFGLIQSARNAVAPHKRPLSSMTPTIVLENGEVRAVVGASGGPRIITSTIQVMLNATEHELPPAEAVETPRIHHQWLPNELLLEPRLMTSVGPALSERGHSLKERNSVAVSQLVVRQPDGLWAVSDPRKHGRPAGD